MEDTICQIVSNTISFIDGLPSFGPIIIVLTAIGVVHACKQDVARV